jgi:hypothetical protein
MLITTSRRTNHRSRLLGRELAMVIPGAKYLPRGKKTVRKLASLSSPLASSLVIVITSQKDQPHELRFLDTSSGWRWLDAKIELSKVVLQRDLGNKIKFHDLKPATDGSRRAKEFADFIAGVTKLPLAEGAGGPVGLVKNEEGLRLQFQEGIDRDVVGPVLHISSYGRLYGEAY